MLIVFPFIVASRDQELSLSTNLEANATTSSWSSARYSLVLQLNRTGGETSASIGPLDEVASATKMNNGGDNNSSNPNQAGQGNQSNSSTTTATMMNSSLAGASKAIGLGEQHLTPNSTVSATTTTTTTAETPSKSFLSPSDMELVNLTARAQANYIISLELPNGAIEESNFDRVVYTRDLALATIGLTLNGYTSQAGLAVRFLISLPQGSSYFTQPSGIASSPEAWYQIYDSGSGVVEQSLRGEDQGMALFAISEYVDATGNYSLASHGWSKIESAANFILYLQKTPEPGMPFTGLYRHGDNWHDTRIENRAAAGGYLYWPYWPEYYHWEEENMRMIMGLKGAISLAAKLGYSSDAKKWNESLSLALGGLTDSESEYGKYETYDYLGSVLWGLQTNLSVARDLIADVPSYLITSEGVKDIPTNTYASSADTIDYMTSLARVGDLSGTEGLLHLVTSNYTDPSGGFYSALSLNGAVESSEATVFASARFLYFAYVVNNV